MDLILGSAWRWTRIAELTSYKVSSIAQNLDYRLTFLLVISFSYTHQLFFIMSNFSKNLTGQSVPEETTQHISGSMVIDEVVPPEKNVPGPTTVEYDLEGRSNQIPQTSTADKRPSDPLSSENPTKPLSLSGTAAHEKKSQTPPSGAAVAGQQQHKPTLAQPDQHDTATPILRETAAGPIVEPAPPQDNHKHPSDRHAFTQSTSGHHSKPIEVQGASGAHHEAVPAGTLSSHSASDRTHTKHSGFSDHNFGHDTESSDLVTKIKHKLHIGHDANAHPPGPHHVEAGAGAAAAYTKYDKDHPK